MRDCTQYGSAGGSAVVAPIRVDQDSAASIVHHNRRAVVPHIEVRIGELHEADVGRIDPLLRQARLGTFENAFRTAVDMERHAPELLQRFDDLGARPAVVVALHLIRVGNPFHENV